MKKFIVLVLFTVLPVSIMAQFAGGLGTEKSPYLISDAYQLADIRSYPDCSFRLINDIDLTEWILDNSPKLGWSPIGSEDSPFCGNFDGGNYTISGLTIHRNTSDNIGLFGYTKGVDSKIKNVCIQSCIVNGRNNVGSLLGQNAGSTLIENCIVNGCQITADSNVGGMVGLTTANVQKCYVFAQQIKANSNSGGIVGNTLYSILGCYAFANIIGGNNIGGIVGYSSHEDVEWVRAGSSLSLKNYNGTVLNCRFDGIVNSISNSGGIMGYNNSSYMYSDISSYNPLTYYYKVGNGLLIDKCFVGNGEIRSDNIACGILGYKCYESYYDSSIGDETSNNVCATSLISGNPMYRIQNVIDGVNNIASITTKFLINGNISDDIEDNEYNGIAYGEKTLKRSATYIGLGWDMNNDWTILENESFPYLSTMSIAPSITSIETSNKCTIRGECAENGKIKIFKGMNCFSSDIVDGVFEISIGAVNDGDTIYYNAISSGKEPSVVQRCIITIEEIEPILILGDTNGDSAIDAADVVGIINYILGKPSSSFNEKNADVNGDGHVLVDDAVGIVQIIMNVQ